MNTFDIYAFTLKAFKLKAITLKVLNLNAFILEAFYLQAFSLKYGIAFASLPSRVSRCIPLSLSALRRRAVKRCASLDRTAKLRRSDLKVSRNSVAYTADAGLRRFQPRFAAILRLVRPWSDSLLKMLYDLPNLTPASGTFRALTSVASPVFWASVLSRVGLVAPTLFWLLLPQGVANGSQDDEGVSSVLRRATVTGVNLLAYTQALWRLLNGCRLPYAPSWTRPTQALLLAATYAAQLVWTELQSRQGDGW
ncbi:hypothetical protein V5799_008033 [Amblyomma americanum]|uniref:Uncharacterized protein n=1 Tax=Amblyomma americanum TaxID=6943 RepID=A0AAQ4FFM3_AMBAM